MHVVFGAGGALGASVVQNLAQQNKAVRAVTTYVIRVDLDKHKIKPVENERFKDAQGKPLKRYEFVIVHVNNQKEQIWTVSKTVCMQIIEQIRKGFN
ncbi:MAG: hypothetical protein WA326_09790, partial [Nitrososphaeraceae archaeon]